MKVINLSIPLVNGEMWDVEAFQVGNFAVHLGGHPNENVWTITHIPTKANIVNGICFSKSRAVKIARMIRDTFSDSDMIFIEWCAKKITKGEILSPEDRSAYQSLHNTLWGDRSIGRYAK